MNIVFAVDAIFPPLTGIGRYAARLLEQLQTSGEIEGLRCFAHTTWAKPDVGNPTIAEAPRDGGPQPQPTAARLLGRLRGTLAANPIATRAYGLAVPWIAAQRLRGMQSWLFHSPNFFLPRFPGPTVSTIHDLSTLHWRECHPEARLALMDRALPGAIERATRLVTPSEAVRQELLSEFRLESDRVAVTPLGVDPVYCPSAAHHGDRLSQRYGLTPGAYLLCVATLEPRKNIDRLLQAYDRLRQAGSEIPPLVIAGAPGWNSVATKKRLDELSADGDVVHLGYVPEEDLPALMACAHSFVFPALYEGFGLPVLEAMACGAPVVCSSTPALAELAGDAALLVDPLDVDAIAAAMQRSVEDSAWRETARERGLARAARYSWEHCLERTLAVYRSALTA
jgi:alpha-1,3-rhamnosyl/mannosyltransferase